MRTTNALVDFLASPQPTRWTVDPRGQIATSNEVSIWRWDGGLNESPFEATKGQERWYHQYLATYSFFSSCSDHKFAFLEGPSPTLSASLHLWREALRQRIWRSVWSLLPLCLCPWLAPFLFVCPTLQTVATQSGQDRQTQTERWGTQDCDEVLRSPLHSSHLLT